MARQTRKQNGKAAAPRKLARYRAKRRFAVTPEPKGKSARSKTAGALAYLIQKHAARRLHYDFRLELGGVLLSWAVTKGPSLDPADKRLAVHVEDHPLEYGGFEGTIPAGEYGGGTVMLWDRGSWEPVGDPKAGMAAGKLKFKLFGARLKGGWVLVRMRGRGEDKGRDNWLLIKERDDYARPGRGDALLQSATKSVASGKTMDQIAKSKSSKALGSDHAEESGRAVARKAERKIPAVRAAKASDPEAAPDIESIAGAAKRPLPEFVPPELCALADAPPAGDEWIHEIKIDGYRAYCRRDGAEVRFLTRREQDWTRRFGSLADAIKQIPAKRFALDGEIAVLDERGASSFAALQQALSAGEDGKLRYIVFDLLHLDGYDLRNAALRDRKRLLRALVPAASKQLLYSDHVDASGRDVFRHACGLALEGVVSKRDDSPYRSGRGGDWVKSKCLGEQEFVIGGYTPPKKAGRSGIGALLIGYYEDEELRYAGHVGTGFTQSASRELAAKLKKLEIDAPPFAELPKTVRSNAHWAEPKLVCEVKYREWTRDGVLRQPSFQGLREDKPPEAVVREDKAIARRARPAAKARPRPNRSAAEGFLPMRRTGSNVVSGVTITHPDREVFPDMGISKLQLAQYYARVANFVLPEVRNRPLSVVRCPSGTQKQCFFQKHFETGLKSLERVAIREKESTGEYVTVRDAQDLVSLVQEGVIELHPWGARADDPESPDRLIFDLDPAPDVKWARVVDAALTMRDALGQIGLTSFVKTTGGKGLHVAVPLRRGSSWTALKEFSRAVAGALAQAKPSSYTASPLKRNRAGKIFIDYLRNDRGSTAVAPYSVRAREHAPVAMPLSWKTLGPRILASDFNVATVPDHLARRKKDPWAKMAKLHQTIPAEALKALGLRT